MHSHLAMLFFSHMHHHLCMADTSARHDHDMACMQKPCKGTVARCEAADSHIDGINWQLSHLGKRPSCYPAHPAKLFSPAWGMHCRLHRCTVTWTKTSSAVMACLYNVHHFVQGRNAHVPPAEVVHANAIGHEGLRVIAEAAGWQNAPATMCMFSNFL